MINNKQKTLINDCYCRLGVLNDITWTAYRDDVFKVEKKYERKHRNTWGDRRYYSRKAITINDSARYFACKHILNALVEEPPGIKSYLHLKRSVFMGFYLVANYRDKIEKSLDGFDLGAFDDLDYADMVQS